MYWDLLGILILLVRLSVMLARLLVVLAGDTTTDLLPTFRTFLGDTYYFHVAVRQTACFFFR